MIFFYPLFFIVTLDQIFSLLINSDALVLVKDLVFVLFFVIFYYYKRSVFSSETQ